MGRSGDWDSLKFPGLGISVFSAEAFLFFVVIARTLKR